MRVKRIGAYAGVDPTAESLHIGHLLPFMPIFWMYMHGYRAFTLIGGTTAKIGDPTGRLKDRDPMKRVEVTANIAKIHYQLKGIWTNVERKAKLYGYEKEWSWKRGIVNNNHWWNSLPMMDVLRRLGGSIRVGPMLSRDTVKTKLKNGDGLSFAEFCYPIMQGWDWWELYKQQKIHMQIGGSDQYGNIIAGVDVVKHCIKNETDPAKKLDDGEFDQPVGFTVPLLTDSKGAKFGKSAGNAIWLDPHMTSPFDAYGYFVSRPDADVEKLLKLFTFMPISKIKEIMEKHSVDQSKRHAQHALAYEVLSLIYSDKVAKETETLHRQLFGVKPVQDESAESQMKQVHTEPGAQIGATNRPRMAMDLPESLIRHQSLPRIAFAAGLTESVAEGQRLCSVGAIYVGGSPGQKPLISKGMIPEQLQFTPATHWRSGKFNEKLLIDGEMMILRRGKHNIRIIKMISDEEWTKSGRTYALEPNKGKVRVMLAKRAALKNGIKPNTPAAQAGPFQPPNIEIPHTHKPYRQLVAEIEEMQSDLETLKSMEELISQQGPPPQ